MKNYIIYGYVYVDSDFDIPFDNAYLYPFNLPLEGNYPFEVYYKRYDKRTKL